MKNTRFSLLGIICETLFCFMRCPSLNALVTRVVARSKQSIWNYNTFARNICLCINIRFIYFILSSLKDPQEWTRKLTFAPFFCFVLGSCGLFTEVNTKKLHEWATHYQLFTTVITRSISIFMDSSISKTVESEIWKTLLDAWS